MTETQRVKDLEREVKELSGPTRTEADERFFARAELDRRLK
jgi:hypothetical protein